MSCSNQPIIFVAYKDPDSALWFGLDWTDRLESGVTLTGHAWDVPAGLTEDSAQLTSPYSKVKLSGGTVGQVYDVVGQVTYSTGEIDEQTIRFIIKER